MYAGPLLLNNMYSELLVNNLLARVNSLGRILRCEFVKFVTENTPRYSKKNTSSDFHFTCALSLFVKSTEYEIKTTKD